MADLIDRQELLRALKSVGRTLKRLKVGKGTRETLGIIINFVEQFPTADAVEVVHGRWEKMGEADYKCSVCGFRFTSCDPVSMFLYCRCGAKMDGERREENAAD